MKWKWDGLLMAGVGIFLVVLATIWVDPDFGWHFRLGETIFRHGFPATDPFSYAMPSYPFVDYEWGTNIVWYWLYPAVGQIGLAVIYAGILVASGWVVMPTKWRKYWVVPALLFWSVALGIFGVRVQVVSWLLVALVIRGMTDEEWRKRWAVFYPLLMLVWVNIHGSYPLGVMFVGLWLAVRWGVNRRVEGRYWGLWLAGIGATLINPYGVRDWLEVVKQISQTGYFSQTIAEWHPFWDKPDVGMVAALALVIFGAWKFWGKMRVEYVAVLAVLVGMGLSQLRHEPLLMLGLVPGVGQIFGELAAVAEKVKWGRKRMRLFYGIWCGLAGVVLVLNGGLATVNFVKFNRDFYPVKAVEYLQTHKVPGRLFSTYGWGGYLIWKLPGQREFADGRMSGFVWKAPKGESDDAFKEYMATVLNLDGLSPLLDKYGVNSVLWEKQGPDSVFWGALKSWREVLFKKQQAEGETVPERLDKLGWRKIYEDKVAVIYVRR